MEITNFILDTRSTEYDQQVFIDSSRSRSSNVYVQCMWGILHLDDNERE